MNFIAFSEQERKEYNDFVDRIPELQQQLWEASQTFKRPERYWKNKAAVEIKNAGINSDKNIKMNSRTQQARKKCES